MLMVNPYTKEAVESLHILLYISVNVRVVNLNGLNSMLSMVKAPKISVAWSTVKTPKMSLVKVLTCGRSCDYRVHGSNTPLASGNPELRVRVGPGFMVP